MNTWGMAAMGHWRLHRPRSFEALESPETFFEALGQEAADRYLAVRDGVLAGVSPNDGTIGWDEFQDRVAQADQSAQEIVEREMIYLPPAEADLAET